MDSTEAPILRGIRTQTCHGCHRPLGDGAHQGSATGKNRCTLPHYFLCKGGIVDTISWKACPEDYIFDPNLISAVGFESIYIKQISCHQILLDQLLQVLHHLYIYPAHSNWRVMFKEATLGHNQLQGLTTVMMFLPQIYHD